jgi:hypothetical protein
MKIQELYIQFELKVKTGHCYLHERYNNDKLFIDFRNSYGVRLKKDDEEFLIDILNDEEWKWFVPNVLRVLEYFSDRLYQKLLYIAVNTSDPSFNLSFIEPCCRVYGAFEVEELLLEYVKNGTREERLNALNGFYWTNVTKIYKYTFKWQWSTNSYKDYRYENDKMIYEEMSPKKYLEYSTKLKKAKFDKYKILLHEFISSNDFEIRYNIALILPKNTDEYPEELKNLASKYLVIKERETIPDNWNDFEDLRNTKFVLFRKIKYYLQKKRNNKNKHLISLKTKNTAGNTRL